MPPVRPPAPAEAIRASRGSLAAGIASVALSVSVVPLAFVTAAATYWYGRRAVKVSRAAGSSTPGTAFVGMTLGSIGLAVAILVVAALAVIWPQFSSYRNCMAGANTGIAQTACKDQFKTALEARFGR